MILRTGVGRAFTEGNISVYTLRFLPGSFLRSKSYEVVGLVGLVGLPAAAQNLGLVQEMTRKAAGILIK